MRGKQKNSQMSRDRSINRRDFIKVTGAVIIVVGTGGCKLFEFKKIPPADGYLLVDIEKCQGCASCMLACSLIHEGVESLSLSRIQIMQNSFAPFPDDLTIEQCRQCVDPACVKVCPTGALKAEAEYGNVRMVDKEKCIDCGACSDACPHIPSRAFIAADKDVFRRGQEPEMRSVRQCPLSLGSSRRRTFWKTSLRGNMSCGRHCVYQGNTHAEWR